MRTTLLIACVSLALSATAAAQTAGTAAHPPELTTLAGEFRAWRDRDPGRVPDYAAHDAERKKGLADYRRRLEAIDPSRWSVHDQVDYLVVRQELDELDFELQITRQVSRNPDFYSNEAIGRLRRLVGGQRQRGTLITVPFDAKRADAMLAALEDTPGIVAQGPKNLTEPVGGMADMALHKLKGIDKNYRAFGALIGPHLPEPQRSKLGPALDKASAALAEYARWIQAERPKMTATHAIGREAFDWYVQRVMLMPYDGDQLLVHAAAERARNWAFMQFERQKNRHLPPLRPARTIAERSEWMDATDVASRTWAEKHALFTKPDDVGPTRAYPHTEGDGVSHFLEPFGFISLPRIAGKPNTQTRFLQPVDYYFSTTYFWERLQTHDPGQNHPHSEYPGHFFEGIVSKRLTCALRKPHNSRGDSWTNYFDEAQLQLDYPFVPGPRARELMYVQAIMRAERVHACVKFADGELTPETLPKYMHDTVPYMDNLVAYEHEVWRKFTNPAQVLTYQVGKFEVYKLMADRMKQLGDTFDLQEFNDALLATGQIPVPLARWEMTGLDDEVKAWFWKPKPLPRSATTSARRE